MITNFAWSLAVQIMTLISMLISLVESNKQIVTSRSLGTAKYWNAVANELNALGPPIHNRNEWKEVFVPFQLCRCTILAFFLYNLICRSGTTTATP